MRIHYFPIPIPIPTISNVFKQPSPLEDDNIALNVTNILFGKVTSQVTEGSKF